MVISEIRANSKIRAPSERGCPDRGGSTVLHDVYTIEPFRILMWNYLEIFKFKTDKRIGI